MQFETLGGSFTEWIADIERNGLIVLPHDATTALVVDAHRPWKAAFVEWGDAATVSRLQNLRKGGRDPRQRIEIHYVGAWPASAETVTAIRELAGRCGPRATSIHVFYDDGEVDLLAGIEQLSGKRGRCAVRFHGRTPELNEDEIEVLLHRGASIFETIGWPREGDPVDEEKLSRLSELGLRVPVTLYLSKGNLSSAAVLARQCLDANYCAGVSFQPASAHPSFTSGDIKQLPDVVEYCRFLVEAYKEFRHYDDVMEPVRSIVDVLRHGGFDLSTEESLPAKYYVDPSGAVRPFRLLSGEWSPNESRLGFPSLCQDCVPCRWRGVCGGCDAVESQIFEVTCKPRMLFIEFLLREMHLLSQASEG